MDEHNSQSDAPPGADSDRIGQRDNELETSADNDLIHAILNSTTALAVVFDSSGRIEYFNRACEIATGFTAAEVVGKSIFDTVIPGDIAPSIRTMLRKLEDTGVQNTGENDWVAKDGSTRRILWTNYSSSSPVSSTGRSMTSIGIDVTSQRNLRNELEVEKAKLRASQLGSDTGAWHWDLESNSIYWSDQLFTMFGLDPNSPPSTDGLFRSLLHPDDKGVVDAALSRTRASGDPFDVTYRVVLPGGETRFFHSWGRAGGGHLGKPRFISGAIRDISEITNERGLLQGATGFTTGRQADEKAGYWHWDFKKNSGGWSPKTIELLRLDPESQLMRLEDFFSDRLAPPPREMAEHVRAVFRKSDSLSFEFASGRGESSAWLCLSGHLQRDEDGSPQVAHGTLIDATIEHTRRKLVSQIGPNSGEPLDTPTGLIFRRVMAPDGTQSVEHIGGTLAEEDSSGKAPLQQRILSSDTVHPDDLPGLTLATERSAIAAEPFSYDYRTSALGSGTDWAWIRLISYPYVGDDRSVTWDCIATDVTAEYERRENESRLKDAQRLAHMGSWEYDVDTGKLTWSDETFRIFGLDGRKTAPDADEFMTLIHPNDRQRLIATIEEGNDSATETSHEYRIIRPDGELRHILETLTREFRGGALVRRKGVTWDITERKIAEIALHDSQQSLQEIADNLPAFIAYLDSNSRFLFVNRAYETAYGIPRDKIIGKYHYELQGNASVPGRAEAFAKALSGEKSSLALPRNYPLIGLRQMEFQFQPDFDSEGEVQGVYILGVDNTERFDADEKIRASQHQLKSITDNIPAFIAHIDSYGRYLFVNSFYERTFGIAQRDFIGKKYTDFVYNSDNLGFIQKKVEQAMLGRNASYNFAREYPDGDERHVQFELSPDTDEHGKVVGVFILGTDTTERRIAELALEESQIDFAEAQRTAQVGSWLHDIVTGTLKYSDEVYRILGVSPDTYVVSVENFLKLVHPGDAEKFQSERPGSMSRDDIDVEHRIVRSDGSVRHVHQISRPVFDPNGIEVVAWRGTIQDITERKIAELELESSERRLIEAQKIGNIGSWQGSNVSAAREYSEQACRIIGQDPRTYQATAEAYIAMIHPDDRANFTEQRDLAIRTRSDFSQEHRIVLPTGEIRHIHVRGQFGAGADGSATVQSGTLQDITERKLAAESLSEVENRLTLAREFAEFGNWDWTPRTGKVIWDDQMWRIFGYEPQSRAPTQSFIAKHVHPADVDQMHQSEQSIIDGQEASYETVYRIIQPSGDMRTVREGALASRSDDGTLEYITGFVLDITAQKEIEEALRASEYLSGSIVRSSLDAVITIDETGRILVFNPAAETIFGCTEAEAMDRNVDTLFVPEELREGHNHGLARARTGGGSSTIDRRRETWANRYNGERFPIELSVTRTGTGETTTFTAHIRDLTQEKARAQELLESEARYRNLFDLTPMPLLLHDGSSALYGNLAANDIFSGSDELSIEKMPLRALSPSGSDDPFQLRSSDVSENVKLKKADGSIGIFDLRTSATTEDTAGSWLTIALERTEAVEREYRIRLLELEHQRSSRASALDEVFSVVAHELNQPLAAIANYADATSLILEKAGTDGPAEKAADLALRTRAEAKRAADVLGSMRRLTQPHKGQRELSDLNKVVSESVPLAKADYGRSTTEFNISFDAPNLWVMCDRILIQQAVLNLIRNAYEALETDSGTSAENPEILVTLFSAGDDACITISDNGPGIPPEIADRLYKPFVTSKKSGMGIGLSICRSAIEAHSGKLWVTPNEPTGTVFHLTLPLQDQPG